jgi:[acyl-carrier-protein] S-malonyltransferase
MTRLLLLCPGQGSQDATLFDLARTDPAGARLLDACGYPHAPADLYANAVAQPAIVAATLAMWEALRGIAEPAVVAGYSIGELAAYGVAGALSATESVALAARRAALMDACAQPAQAMLAVSDLTPARAAQALRASGYAAAIETGEQTCIAGGPAAALEAARAAVAALGGRSSVLPVAVASHTPLMRAAVAPFAEALRNAHWQPWRATVLSGIAAAPVRDAAMACEHLSRQLAETIRWMDCMDACVEAGVGVALELGPGNALSRMLQARHPHLACRSVTDFRSIAGIRTWLARQTAG